MGFYIIGPDYVEPEPLIHDTIDAVARAAIKLHLQTWVGTSNKKWSADAVKEGIKYSKQALNLKIKKADAESICLEIANEWAE